MYICVYLVPQSCRTLCNPMDCSPPGLYCSWDSPGKNTGVCGHSLLQGIFLTQGSNLGLLLCSWILYCLKECLSLSLFLEQKRRLSSIFFSNTFPLVCFLKFFNLFRLYWVFVALLRLSLVGASGGCCSLWCSGFSLWWPPLLRSTGVRVHGLQ